MLKGKKKKVVAAQRAGSEARKMKAHSGFYQMLLDLHRNCLQQHGVDLVDHIVARAGSNLHWSNSCAREKCLTAVILTLAQLLGNDVTKRVVFTGHSMGAALAAMVAYQAVSRYPAFRMRLYLVLLGSPRFARRSFCAWLNTELRNRILQYALPSNHASVQQFFGTWEQPILMPLLCPASR